MMKNASKYAPNKIASPKKHIFARLLDYFLTFISALTLFAFALPISMNFPLHKSILTELSAARKELYKYIDSTAILHFDEDETDLLTINEEAEIYLKNLAKTSAYVHDLGFPVKQNDGTYLNVPVEVEETFIYDKDNFPLDNISYFFRVFKRNHEDLNDYNGKKYDELTPEELDQYQYINIMKLKESNYVVSTDEDYLLRGEGISRFVVLNTENTEQLLRYYKNDRNDTSLYNSIYGCYAKGLQKAINQVESKSVEHHKIEKRITAASKEFSAYQIICYLICYTVAYILLNMLVSLVSKEWTTAGQKAMKIGMSDLDEMEPTIWQYLLYHFLSYLAFFSSSLLTFMLLGNFGVTSLVIVGPISFLMVMLFVLPFNVVSLFLPFFSKNYRHDLTTFLTRIVLKDKNEFDVPVGADISDKAIDGKY